MGKILILAGAIAFTAAAAAAAAPGQEPAVAAEAADAEAVDLDKVICKRSKVTGSRVQKQKICMTRREWTRLTSETRTRVSRQVDETRQVPTVQ